MLLAIEILYHLPAHNIVWQHVGPF